MSKAYYRRGGHVNVNFKTKGEIDMNKFQKVIDILFKTVNLMWNIFAVVLMGVYAIVQLSYSDYTIAGYTPSILWFLGLTVFINVMTVWNRILIRSKTKK